MVFGGSPGQHVQGVADLVEGGDDLGVQAAVALAPGFQGTIPSRVPTARAAMAVASAGCSSVPVIVTSLPSAARVAAGIAA